MITINSVTFYKQVYYRPNGTVKFSGAFSRLQYKVYPVTPRPFTLAVDCHAVGEMNSMYAIRVRLDDAIIHQTALASLQSEGVGTARDFGFITTLEGLTFPSPGTYSFEIMFDDVCIHSALLFLD